MPAMTSIKFGPAIRSAWLARNGDNSGSVVRCTYLKTLWGCVRMQNRWLGCLAAFRARLAIYFTVLLALGGVVPVLYAQQYSGTIVGTVNDQVGAVVSGASVTIVNTGTNASVTVKSDQQGNFVAAQLPVGIYEVHCRQGNFKEYVETGVEVHTSSNTRVNAVLAVGAAKEQVTVSASQVQVETTSPQSVKSSGATRFANCPWRARTLSA